MRPSPSAYETSGSTKIPRPPWEVLSKLRSSYAIRTLSERGRQRMGRLMPTLLRTVVTRRDPLSTLRRVVVVIESIARRSVYLSLLIERPLALSQLIKLCEGSPMITRQFAKHPLVLDELLDSRTLYSPNKKQALADELRSRLQSVTAGDVEQEMDVLRQFHHASMLRIAAADIGNVLDVTEVSTCLTELAEVCLQAVLDLSYRDMVARYGRPRFTVEGQTHDAAFAIIAYGKFGSGELGYGSDLDLVFLHASRGEAQHTNGDKSVENSVFFVRLAQRIIHMLSTHTADGKLYESDTRLRPSGSDGLLVSSIDAFESYQHEQAWVWEHQALVRARFVAGNPALGEHFGQVRRSVLTLDRDEDQLRRDVSEMRLRMRNEHGSKDTALFDLKHDDGGIADIEFMVQYAALRWGQRLGDALASTNTERLMRAMAELGVMQTEDVDTLLDAYERYRASVHTQSLQEESTRVRSDDFTTIRTKVTKIWQKWFD